MKRQTLLHVLCLVALLIAAFGSDAFARPVALHTFYSPLPPTPAPSPPVDAPGPTNFPALETFADPPIVAPGEITHLYWRLANESETSGPAATLIARLPRGLHVLKKSVHEPLQYDPNEHSITWQVGDIPAHMIQEASVAVRPTGLRPGEAVDVTVEWFVAGASDLSTSQTAITIAPEAPEVGTMTHEGGEIALEDGRIRLTVPAGTVDERVTIRARKAAKPQRAPTSLLEIYEFRVQGPDGAARHVFDPPLTLTIRRPGLSDSAAIVLQNDETGAWEPLPTTWDAAAETLSASLPHLSLVGVDDSHMPLALPSLGGIHTDLFTGAASIGYPIPVPPGAGGLQPTVKLQFNSRNRAEDPGYSATTGNGWRLSVDSYGAWTPWIGGSPGRTWRINGVSYTEGNGTLQQAPDWRFVQRGEYFDFYSPDGVTYRFAEALHDFWCPQGGTPRNWRAVTWMLTTVTDSLGNTIQYTYDNPLPVTHATELNNVNLGDGLGRTLNVQGPCLAGFTTYLSQINLTRISYNQGRSVIEFEYAKLAGTNSLHYRKDGPFTIEDAHSNGENAKKWAFFTTRLLRGIRIKQDSKYIAGYDIGYDERVTYDQQGRAYPSASRYQVKGIQQMNLDENTGAFITQNNEAWRAGLPPMRFYNFYCHDAGKDPTAENCTNRDWNHLYTADNMYGARVSFAYAGGVSNGTVTSRTIVDQVTGQSNTWSYAYGSSIWHKVEIGGVSAEVGYASVTETLPASLSPAGTVYHEFLNDDETDVASFARTIGRLGKERLQRHVVNGVLQREIERWWEDTNTGVLNGAGLTYLGKEEERTYNALGQNPQYRTTRYTYDVATGHQGSNTRPDAQFGLATRILEYNGTETPANLYRTTERWYFGREEVGSGSPTTDRYIVNQLAQEILWDNRNQGNTCQKQTRYIYDVAREAGGPDKYTQRPSRGLLKEVWQAGDQGAACDAGWLRQAAYDHDAWGNVTWQKTPNGTVTTTAYDRDFSGGYALALYPFTRTVTPQNAQDTPLTTSYRYYGLYGAEAGGSGRAGQLQQSIDPNNAVTRYSYDVFGRLKDVRQPGASFAAPASEIITYSDVPYPEFGAKLANQYPLRVKQAVRSDANGDGSGGASYQEAWAYYDGLGQTIQTQKPGANANQAIVVDLAYNALGQPARQTVSYFKSAAPGGVWSADWSRPQVQLAYDALGRLIQQTNPDGQAVKTYYNGRHEARVDEKYHETLRETDAFGRVVAVRQLLGAHPTPDWNTANRYAEAKYSYAVTDQLEGVDQLVDASNQIHTSIWYDRLGNKVQMTDPDMGAWTYAYDAMGNVKRQTDARGKTVCFYYDGHNRLKGKHYRNDASCPPASPTPSFDVAYGYDAGPNAKGRRTAMTVYAAGVQANRLAWTYDVRGRVATETRTIAGLTGSFTTGYTYDAADRLRTLTYPDGEVVTTGYHSTLGWPQTLQSSLTGPQLVAVDATAGYDEAGRLKAVAFPAGSPAGTTLWRRQEYYPWTERYHTGRLKTIRVETGLNLGDRLNLHDYQYDDVGNVTALADGAAQYAFQYDDLDRLTAAYGQSYAYDPAGRLTQFAGSTYTPDPQHPHAVRQINGGVMYAYDANGNLSTRFDGSVGQPLVWDHENRLLAIGNPPGGANPPPGSGPWPKRLFLPLIHSRTLYETYAYDGDGQRIKKYTPQATTYYVALHYELTVAGGQTKVTKYYTFNGQRLVMRLPTGALNYLHTDHLGSVVAATDASGALVANNQPRYDAYGNERTPSVAGLPTELSFTGQRRDGSGLLYFGARYYDPALGTFISADSIIVRPGDPASLNRYAFAANNPLRYADPSGHDAQDVINSLHEITGGFLAQWGYVNSLQAISALAAMPGESPEATAGRHLANVVAIVQGAEQMGAGTGLVAGGVAACGTGVLCLAGVPAVVAGGAVAAHGVGVTGIAVAQEGQMLGNWLMMAKNDPVHHIATNKNWISDPQWSKQFKTLFDKGELDLNRAANKLEVPGHTGPHSQGYHQWVYRRLNAAIEGLTDKVEIGAALERELQAIGQDILANPGLLSQ